MSESRASRWVAFVGVLAIGVAAGSAACGGGSSGGSTFGSGGNGAGDGTGGDGFGGGIHMGNVQSISIDPPTASIESLNGSKPTQKFKLKVRLVDGSITEVTQGISWSADAPQAGAIDNGGLFKASGSIGAKVNVGATYGGKKGSAVLTVKLHLTQNAAAATPQVQHQLDGASTPDAGVTWAYPYNGTVWPRGLNAPLLMWNGGAPSDVYMVKVQNSTFELDSFINAPNAPTAQVPFDEVTWQQLVDSSDGKTSFKVARWDGTNATVVADHDWSIAPASMRGTIYYWSNNLGRVLRIKPGSPTPDDFANQAPLDDPNQYTPSSCLMTCHTVSADGSTLVSGGGIFGGSYNLASSQPEVYLGGTWGPSSGGRRARRRSSSGATRRSRRRASTS